MQITLSNKQVVTLRDKFTRAADRAYDEVVYTDAVWGRNDEGKRVIESIPPQNVGKAVEAALPHMVMGIKDANGADIPFNQSWIDHMDADDFALLMSSFLDIKSGDEQEGKKNSGGDSANGGGVDAGAQPSGASPVH